jgi:RHS repeat-associated protein
MNAGNALELRVSANPSIDPHTTFAATLTKLNGHAVSGSLYRTGMGKHSEQTLYYYFPEMAQGFTAEGTVSLTYRRKHPTGSRLQFTVRAGTIPCDSPSNSPPTVSITSPLANSTFSAPVTITVSANAQDSNGTITQVAFYANSNLIGTASSNPFAIQWTSVQAGVYDLTAVATNDEGLQTTSAAVPVTVSAAQALYFIHIDHLNAPRLITDNNQKTIWTQDTQEPFGNNSPNEDPDGDDVRFEFPLRSSAQHSDRESGLAHNYFRDYSSELGRYVESDPIGLNGGLNSFNFAYMSPLMGVDPRGLWSEQAHRFFIKQAFPHLSPALLASMMAGSEYVDSAKFQTPAFAYMHAMSSSMYSPEEARKLMCRFIDDQMKAARDFISKGRFEDAAAFFGRALHPIMDSTSPAHANFKKWRYRDAMQHGNNLFGFPSEEDLDTAFGYEAQTVALMRGLMRGENPMCDPSCKRN